MCSCDRHRLAATRTGTFVVADCGKADRDIRFSRAHPHILSETRRPSAASCWKTATGCVVVRSCVGLSRAGKPCRNRMVLSEAIARRNMAGGKSTCQARSLLDDTPMRGLVWTVHAGSEDPESDRGRFSVVTLPVVIASAAASGPACGGVRCPAHRSGRP